MASSMQETTNVTAINIDLARVGKGISQDFTAVVAGSGFYGIYVVLFCAAVYSILRQPRWFKQTPSVVLLSSISVMFILATFLWAANVALLYKRIRIVLVDQYLGPLHSRLTISNTSTSLLRYMTDIMFIIEYLIGDALIGWRVFVLHRWSPWVVGSLSLVWLGTAGTGVGLLACMIDNHFASQLPKKCTDLENSSWTISLGYNFIATIMFTVITWNRRKVVQAAQKTRKTKVDRVLYILVSSGLVYLALGCMRLTLFANSTLNPLPGTVSHANIVLEFMFNQIVGIYPTLVTTLVLNERALFSTGLSSTYVASSGAQPSQSIHFKTRSGQQGTGIQLESTAPRSPTTLDAAELSFARRPSSSFEKPDMEKAP
ncbi:hypothetical protein BKA62DRAFT_105488 [Auriculariales sp. MPI-PUGE-AT-0066]|nr:hypothetical protein BKA62DRAFT_105488 [Auriculariales sp. MPI-PUGE-AT-0066]